MAIISSYFKGETYGILGPQMAATIIQENTLYDCIVVAVTREDDKRLIKKSLADYFGMERPVIGFSTLSGREDLFSLAKELKDEGATTILAGPQADADYLGESGWRDHPNRFQGLSEHFTCAIHGPAEQAIHLLDNFDGDAWRKTPGLIYSKGNDRFIQNPKNAWDERYLKNVNWDNIYGLVKTGLAPIKITTGQILQQIGCPYAAVKRWAMIDYPVSAAGKNSRKVKLVLRGCSFCDIAADKGFYGELAIQTVLQQIEGLPELPGGRKIPFELINENPLPGLPHLIHYIKDAGINLSQINLTMRADWLVRGRENLIKSLELSKSIDTRILLASAGFESFDNTILSNLNKGLSTETNIQAITLMRHLKDKFPREWGYSRDDGAIHGLIHPTPWDTSESSSNIQKILNMYALQFDILPPHSTPLIIHHASALGRWVRQIERQECIEFKRYGNIIGWW